MKNLELISIEKIPKAIDVPLNNLIELLKIVFSMEIVCDKNNGIGLSAVQVGVPWKLFIIKNKKKYDYYVNCEYEGIGEKVKSIESCLSIKNEDNTLRYFEVDRYKKIKAFGKRLIYEPELRLIDVKEDISDYYAIIFQHEVDHHNFILISNIGKEVQLTEV